MHRLREQLLALAHELGDKRQMAICGEGNISGQLGPDRILIKASGTSLRTLRPEALVEVRTRALLQALREERAWTDQEVEDLLMSARCDSAALKPSVETLFHAWLLSLPNVRFVGHVHPIATNQVLASARAAEFAIRRILPDQVVYCGARSLLVPYVDPGLALARRIREVARAFQGRYRTIPRTILLQNHGIIATGSTPAHVSAALAMAEKAAAIMVGAAALGGLRYMDPKEVDRIASRADEHYRRAMLQPEGRGKV